MPEAPRRGRAAAALAVVAAGVAVAGFLVTQSWPETDSSPVAGSGAPVVAAGPPSAVSPPPADPADVATDTAVPARAAVQITYAGADEAAGGVTVGAYVAGVIEDGGRCGLVLSRDGASAAAESESAADARTTSCGQLLVPFSELSPGTWTAEVTYTSPRGSEVAAAQVPVEVP